MQSLGVVTPSDGAPPKSPAHRLSRSLVVVARLLEASKLAALPSPLNVRVRRAALGRRRAVQAAEEQHAHVRRERAKASPLSDEAEG